LDAARGTVNLVRRLTVTSVPNDENERRDSHPISAAQQRVLYAALADRLLAELEPDDLDRLASAAATAAVAGARALGWLPDPAARPVVRRERKP
jgi:hypothetical protein